MRGATSRAISAMDVRFDCAGLSVPTEDIWALGDSTDLLAAAMLELAVTGSEKKILNTGELNALTRPAS
jgi:hypothetical protein